MTLREIRGLFEYDAWATERTLEPVSTLPDRTYHEDLKSSHGGIHGTLVHIYSADMIWLRRWSGSSPNPIAPGDVPDLETLTTRWREYHGEMDRLLSGLGDAALVEPFAYTDPRGNRQSDPLFHQMLQLLTHSSYHRGQVVTMLRQVGGKPVGTDLITFYRTRPTRSLRETLEGQNY